MNKLALAAALLAAPLAARADIGLRLGAEAGIAHHDSNRTTYITDNFPLALNGMLSYWLPGDILSIDGELSEAILLNPPNGVSARQGTTFRVGATLSPPVLPIYLRAAIPLHFEPSPFLAGLRLGAGLTFPWCSSRSTSRRTRTSRSRAAPARRTPSARRTSRWGQASPSGSE